MQEEEQKEIQIIYEEKLPLNELIGKFSVVNPSFKTFYSNKTQRKALERMLKEHGKDKVVWVIGVLPKTNAMEYAPVITTPMELERKLGKLIAFLKRKKDKPAKFVKI